MWYIENRNSTTFNIYGDCNQECPFCSGYPRIDFTFDMLKKKVKWLQEISLQWGEPTLSPFLFELLDFARENGTEYINLITNGFKIAEKDFAEKIAGKIDCYHFAFMSHKKQKADILWWSSDTLLLKSKALLNLISLWEWRKIRIVHIIQRLNLEDLTLFPLFIHKYFPEVSLIEFKYIQHFWNKYNVLNIPLYSDSYKYINKTLELCEQLWIKFLINGIPLCFLEKRFHRSSYCYYNDNSVEQMKIYATQKFEKCQKCEDSKHCIGVRQDYVLLHWNEEFR